MKVSRNKILKYTSITIGAFLLLLLLIQWGISRYLSPIVASQLKSKIAETSDGMYKIHFEKLKVNLTGGKLRLKDIHIRPNKNQILQKYEDCELSTHNIFNLKIPRFTIEGIGIYEAVVNKHININQIQLKKAAVQMLQLEKRNCPSIGLEDSTKSEEMKPLEELQSFFIGKILIEDTKFEYLKLKGEDTLQVAVSHSLNAHLSDLEMAKPQYMGETFQDLPIKASNITFDIYETIVPLPKSPHNLGIARTSFSLDESLLKLQSLQLIPKNGENKNVRSVEIQEIALNTADFFDGDYKALMGAEEWTIPAIELNEPKIVLTKDREIEMPKKDLRNGEVKPIDLQQILTPKFRAFGIESFKINNASLSVLDAESQEELTAVDSIYLFIHNFRIDESLQENTEQLFYADDFKFKVESFWRKLPDARSILSIDQMNLDMVNAKASLKDISVNPVHSKIELGHIVGHRAPWTRLQNTNVFLRDFDLNAFLTKRALNAKKILITDALVETFMDQRLKNVKATKEKFMPQALLQNLPITVTIDNIEVKDSRVEYTAYGAQSTEMAVFTLEDFNANINNLTNNELLITRESKMTLDATTNVMGTGFLKLNFVFPLSSKDHTHTFSGHLSEMNMTDFNSILEIVPARVDEGKINKINFSVVATDKRARGKLQFYYKDLKLKLKDKFTGEVSAKQDIISFFADKLFIRNDNPRRNGNFREGVIDYERDKSKSIINFWWKSILTGILSSVSSKNLVNEDTTSAEVLEKMKKRQKKKARRKERRKQLRSKLQRLLEKPF